LDGDTILAIRFLQKNPNAVFESRLNLSSDKISLNGQLPVSSINEYGQLNGLRTTEIHQSVERSTYGAPSEKHVIHDHNSLVRNVEIYLCLTDDWAHRAQAQIIAVECDIEDSKECPARILLLQNRLKPMRQRDTPRPDANKSQLPAGIAALNLTGNLMEHLDNLLRSKEAFRHGPSHLPIAWDSTSIGCFGTTELSFVSATNHIKLSLMLE